MRSVRVAAAASSVRMVRALLRRELAHLPPEVCDDAALVVTELLCNALEHGGRLEDGTLEVRWDVLPEGVKIAVVDGGGSSVPTVRESSLTATVGRGLSIVSRLVSRWGVERHPGQTLVWAIVPLAESARMCG
ncbi:MAG: ATP-binding protein [Acidothermus sp.]|nr:ATP-binding protein [Acidothermus sp.]MCL6537417.1 ATP-binding protein [Acidothermus sp.]